MDLPAEIERYVVEKGSLTVDGISLTVARLAEGVRKSPSSPHIPAYKSFVLAPGNAVNLECDVLAKYVERLLQPRAAEIPSRLSLERLAREGF